MLPNQSPLDSGFWPAQSHGVEREVHRRLQAHPGLRLQSLVVHRTPRGVCLEGCAEQLQPELDLYAALGDIDGVCEVINHLLPPSSLHVDEIVHSVDEDEEELALGYHR